MYIYKHTYTVCHGEDVEAELFSFQSQVLILLRASTTAARKGNELKATSTCQNHLRNECHIADTDKARCQKPSKKQRAIHVLL